MMGAAAKWRAHPSYTLRSIGVRYQFFALVHANRFNVVFVLVLSLFPYDKWYGYYSLSVKPTRIPSRRTLRSLQTLVQHAWVIIGDFISQVTHVSFFSRLIPFVLLLELIVNVQPPIRRRENNRVTTVQAELPNETKAMRQSLMRKTNAGDGDSKRAIAHLNTTGA